MHTTSRHLNALAFVLALLPAALGAGCSSVIEKPDSWENPPPVQRLQGTASGTAAAAPDFSADDDRLEAARTALQAGNQQGIPVGPGLVVPQVQTPQSGADTTCMLIAGDSWASFDVLYGATRDRLRRVYPDCEMDYLWNTEAETPDSQLTYWLVYPGSRAEQWKAKANYGLIINGLARKPSAKVLVMYISGNDIIKFLKSDQGHPCGNPNGPPVQDHGDRLINCILDDVFTIVHAVHAAPAGSNVKILIVGYSKPNLSDSAFGAPENGDPAAHPMSSQTAFNAFLHKYNQKLAARAAQESYVDFIDNADLFDGNPHKGTPREYMVNGYIPYGPFDWMRSYRFVDAIHIGKPANYRIAERTITRLFCNRWVTGTEPADSYACPAR